MKTVRKILQVSSALAVEIQENDRGKPLVWIRDQGNTRRAVPVQAGDLDTLISALITAGAEVEEKPWKSRS